MKIISTCFLISCCITTLADVTPCEYDQCEIALSNDTAYDIQVKVDTNPTATCMFFGMEQSPTNILPQHATGTYLLSCDKEKLSHEDKSITFIVSDKSGYCANVLVSVQYGEAFPQLVRSVKERLGDDCTKEIRYYNTFAAGREFHAPYAIDFRFK